MSPIDRALEAVEWVPAEAPPPTNELYATHSGVLDVAGTRLRIYRLNDGRAVINADDLNAFFEAGLA